MKLPLRAPVHAALVAALCGLTSLACTPRSAAPRAVDAPGIARHEPRCDDVDGAAALLVPGRLIVIGEMHGAEEFPTLVRALACEAALRGPVTVHLELPRSEQARIDGLAREPVIDAVPRDGAWADPFQSGRTSRAMWSLLRQLGALARETGRVRVDPFDGGEANGRERDRGMAAAVERDVRAHPSDVHLALVGNLHSRVEKGTPFDPEMEPFAYLLAQHGVAVTSLLGTYAGGSIWACSSPDPSSCGIREVPARGAASRAPSLRLAEGATEGAHHGTAFVGELHASPPALARSAGDDEQTRSAR